MVQKCFIDESYDEKTFVLSCSIAPEERWIDFENTWRVVLEQVNARLESQGRQRISRYHATYCAGMSGEFEGWNVEEQKELTAALIDALRKVPMHSVAHTLLLNELREVFAAHMKVRMHHDNLLQAAYFLTMQHCMLDLGAYLFKLNPGIRVSFIHDHSDYNSELVTAFNHVKHTLRPPFADLFESIAPTTSKECLPLQLADFLAYEFFRDRGGEETKGESYRRRRSLDITLQTGTGVVLKTIRKDWIERLMDASGAQA